MTVRISLAMARAAGWDEGNRSMRAAGRTAWNEEDWRAAVQVVERYIEAVPPGRQRADFLCGEPADMPAH